MYTFVVPSFGSLGTQALSLIKDIGRRTYLFVPPALAHETSWATMSITSFLRSTTPYAYAYPSKLDKTSYIAV